SRFHAAGAGGGEDHAVILRPECLLKTGDQLPLERHVLRAAMIDHLGGEGAQDDVRAWRRAGDHQQLLAQGGSFERRSVKFFTLRLTIANFVSSCSSARRHRCFIMIAEKGTCGMSREMV